MSNITVLMSSYNGKKYIEDQLKSLRKQDRKIEEVIIISMAYSNAFGWIVYL